MSAVDPNVQVTLISVMGSIGVALLEAQRRNHKALKEVKRHSTATREQVQNSHETNLRDDVDRVLTGVETLLTNQEGVMEDIRQLRSDLAVERKERLAGDERLADQIVPS